MILLLSVMMVGCAPAPSQREAAPAAAEGESGKDQFSIAHNFGRLFAGEIAKHQFEFVNQTGVTLDATAPDSIRRSCGCASADAGKLTLSPGESTTVTVSINTTGKVGEFANNAQIHWLKPDQTSFDAFFELRGTALSGFHFEPPVVLISSAEISSQKAIDISVKAAAKIDWDTFQINQQIPGLSAEIVPTSKPDHRTIRLKIGTQNRTESIVEKLRVSAKLDEQKLKDDIQGILEIRFDLSDVPRLAGGTVRVFDADKAWKGEFFVKGKLDSDSLRLTIPAVAPAIVTDAGDQRSTADLTVFHLTERLHRIAFVVSKEVLPLIDPSIEMSLEHNAGNLGRLRFIQ